MQPSRPPSGFKELVGVPWLFGSLAIVVAFAVEWVSDIVYAFQHYPGGDFSARGRVLRFFSIGTPDWALALLLAALLLALGSRVFPPPAALARRLALAHKGVALASAVVIVSAVVSVIVSLSLAGHGVDEAVSDAINNLAAVLIAGASGLWSYRSVKGSKPRG